MGVAQLLRALAVLATCCAIPVAFTQGAGPPVPFEDHGACPLESEEE